MTQRKTSCTPCNSGISHASEDCKDILNPSIRTYIAPAKPTLKARMSLLEQEFLMEMAKVGDFGTQKYAEEDWRNNEAVTVKKRLDSLMRHIAKFASSSEPDNDSDTNLSHLCHAAYNCMMIWWIEKNKKERDDRWKG